MGMFDSQSKILKEFKHNMQMKVYEEDYLQNGIPKEVFIKRLAKKSYAELSLNDFNTEYPTYETHVEALVKKGDLWKTGLERLLLPVKGQKPPVVKATVPPKKTLAETVMPMAMPKKEPKEHSVLEGQEDVHSKKGATVTQEISSDMPKKADMPAKKAQPKKKTRLVLTLGVMVSTFAIGSVLGVLLRHNGF